MPRTRAELEQAAAEAEAWLNALDPDTTPAEDISDLRAVAQAVAAVAGAQRHLEQTVASARAKGRSWGRIGLALGVSRQAAQERYEGQVPKRDGVPPPKPEQRHRAAQSG